MPPRPAVVFLVYVSVSMALGMAWHFALFPKTYENLGIYNQEPPIIPLGLLSMVVQGLVIADVHEAFQRARPGDGTTFRVVALLGSFLFSVSTLANAAKIQVSSMTTWIAVQSAFHVIQFGVVGVGIALARRLLAAKGD